MFVTTINSQIGMTVEVVQWIRFWLVSVWVMLSLSDSSGRVKLWKFLWHLFTQQKTESIASQIWNRNSSHSIMMLAWRSRNYFKFRTVTSTIINYLKCYTTTAPRYFYTYLTPSFTQRILEEDFPVPTEHSCKVIYRRVRLFFFCL
jgi:hypothetical protein